MSNELATATVALIFMWVLWVAGTGLALWVLSPVMKPHLRTNLTNIRDSRYCPGWLTDLIDRVRYSKWLYETEDWS